MPAMKCIGVYLIDSSGRSFDWFKFLKKKVRVDRSAETRRYILSTLCVSSIRTIEITGFNGA